ncbi:MAG TPA: TRAP transporter substrate-binding protein DctP [Bradyrhizobium sp.]|nr:TRAP transporter substrate-binding protein DctP [Bradyrhizobium sp.]
MNKSMSRRTFMITTAAIVATPAVFTRAVTADEPILLRCSLETVPSHARNITIRDYFSKIEAAAHGRIKTQLYESGQLFPDLQVGKALLQGQIEMAAPGSWSLTGLISDADFLQLPLLYGRPIDALHRVVDGLPGKLLAAQIEAKLGAHVIGPWLDLGFFNWYSTAKPLKSYGDLKGMKIRNNGGAGQAWRTQFMGAVPNTTPLPNVALALSQGTFDGLITTNETVASARYWEAGIRHALEDHQFIGEYIPIVSLAFWTKLSPDLQQLLTGLWQENVSVYRANMADAQARARDTIQEHGIAIVVPAPEELDATRQKMIAEQDHIVKQSKISAEMLAAVSTVLAGAG